MENNANNGSLINMSAELVAAQQRFAAICQEADDLQLANNAGAAFTAAALVVTLREVLTPQVMTRVFMPLMNTKIGFLTDKDPNRPNKSGIKPTPYSMEVVRDAIIDGIAYGLLPSGNQINIISGTMYPTKEGFTALLKKIGCRYFISYSTPKINEQTADVECKISYEWRNEKKSFNFTANVKRDAYSSLDQIKGKAERKAKKVLYEYLTGIDFGDADEDSSTPIEDQPTVEVKKEEMRQAGSTKVADTLL